MRCVHDIDPRDGVRLSASPGRKQILRRSGIRGGLFQLAALKFPGRLSRFGEVRDATGGHGGALAFGVVYAQSGRRAEALKIIDELRKRSQSEYVPAFWFAAIYAGLGENDQALNGWKRRFMIGTLVCDG